MGILRVTGKKGNNTTFKLLKDLCFTTKNKIKKKINIVLYTLFQIS